MADEWDEFDLSEFTKNDFKEIDAEVAKKLSGEPQLQIQIGPRACDASPKPRQRSLSAISPAQEYRSSGIYSVTDFSALSWCELQFDYGLRQKRFKPLTSRPASFTSAQGKKIHVEKSVAVKNDRTTKRGKVIHKVLEREVRPAEVQVTVTSSEEKWALRLVNMIACLRSVRIEGITREMPILGIVHGEIVVGIIDEVARQRETFVASEQLDQSNMLPSQKESACRNISTQVDIPTMSRMEQSSPSFSVIRITDTKTRRTNTLPSEEDTLSSRIQLMLYHRLLNDLLCLTPPFNFQSLWTRLRLNPSERFSEKFRSEVGLTAEPHPMYCLNDLVKVWMEYISESDISAVDPVMEIIYRRQPHHLKHRKGKLEVVTPSTVSQEDADLANAIKLSLHQFNADRPEELSFDSQSYEDDARNNIIETTVAVHQSSNNTLFKENFNKTLLEDTLIESNGSKIIGRKQFRADEFFLDEYLRVAMEWWHGRRSPLGVSMQNTGRCFSCEYINGCEWREERALEFQSQLRMSESCLEPAPVM